MARAPSPAREARALPRSERCFRSADATARLAGRDTFQHDEFANADGNSPGYAEWNDVCTRARAGGKRERRS